MEVFKISNINDKINISLLFYIIKKNIYVIATIIVLSLLFSFIYLRYTQNKYLAYSIIQINTTNTARELLEFNISLFTSPFETIFTGGIRNPS